MNTPPPPTVCYYISGHGLGHASRAVQVISRIDPKIRVIVKSMADPNFITRESARPIELHAQSFDIGVLQKNNRELDWKRTFDKAAALQQNYSNIINSEARFLRDERVSAVISDVPALPLCAARRAGVPSILVANFTWADIYRPQISRHPRASDIVEHLYAAYQCADLTLYPGLALPMKWLPNRKDVSLIARKGKNIRTRLARELRIPNSQKLVLLYFGNMGDADLQLQRAQHIKGTTFLSFTDLGTLSRRLNQADWHFPDVLASVDAVIAKPGYGTIGECMANGIPVVYYPRPEFAEYPAIRSAIDEWGGGVRISSREFGAGRWQNALRKAYMLRPRKVLATGAGQIAREISRLLKERMR